MRSARSCFEQARNPGRPWAARTRRRRRPPSPRRCERDLALHTSTVVCRVHEAQQPGGARHVDAPGHAQSLHDLRRLRAPPVHRISHPRRRLRRMPARVLRRRLHATVVDRRHAHHPRRWRRSRIACATTAGTPTCSPRCRAAWRARAWPRTRRSSWTAQRSRWAARIATRARRSRCSRSPASWCPSSLGSLSGTRRSKPPTAPALV